MEPKGQTVITENLEIYIRSMFYGNFGFCTHVREPKYAVDNN